MSAIIKLQNFLINNKRSLLLFLIIGGITFVINLSVFTLLWRAMGVYYQVAVTVAFLCALVFHFTTNRRFTFKGHGGNFWRHLRRYSFVAFINYILTIMVVRLTVETLHLSPYLGIVFSIGVTLIFGYSMSKLWIYRKIREPI